MSVSWFPGDQGRGILAQSVRAGKGGGWGVGFRLVGVHREGTLAGQFFILSRNWLALGGAVPPGPGKHCRGEKKDSSSTFLGSCLTPFYNKGEINRRKTNKSIITCILFPPLYI